MAIIFYLTLFFCLFILTGQASSIDYDFFARLIVGKTFFQTGDILKYDFLSYGPSHPWYDHEWGASVIFYFIHDRFGDIGLILLTVFCLFITFFLLIQIIKLRRQKLNPDNKEPLNFIYFYVLILVLQPFLFFLRCHHFTFVFFALWLYILEKARLEKNYKILWALPFLMIVWSNIHGGCFMALGITGIYAVGEFLAGKPFMPFIYLDMGSFLSMFINPYGIKYVLFLIEATSLPRTNIVEWRPTFAPTPISNLIRFRVLFVEFIFLSLYAFFKGIKNSTSTGFIKKVKEVISKFDITKVLLITVLAILSVKAMRFVTYFVFILLPFCYDDFYKIFSFKIFTKLQNKIKEIIIFCLMSVALVLNLMSNEYKYLESPNEFPIVAVQYLIQNEVKGNIMVPFQIGSYVSYKLYPNNFILMDGRYEEVYDVDLNDHYLRYIVLGDIEWKEMFDSIHHDALICYKTNPIYENMKTHPDFYHVIESRDFALFIRKDVYEKIKQPAKVPVSDQEFYDNRLFETNIDWLKK